MDFQALTRRELQALCKRNSIRANMTNAAMAEALRSLLPSVDGIDEIGRAEAPAMPAVKSAEEVTGEDERPRCPLPRARRGPAMTRRTVAEKIEDEVPDPATTQRSQSAAATDAAAPSEEGEVIGKEQVQCPLPRGARARAKSRRAAADKTEEAVPAPATLEGSQSTAAGEAVGTLETEQAATGKRRTRRSGRSKVKMASDQKEEAAAQEQKEQKDDSSDTVIESAVLSEKNCNYLKEDAVVDQATETTKLQEGENVTRRSATHKTEVEDTLHRRQRTVPQENVAPVEAEEVPPANRRTRRSGRSKRAAVARKEQNADSSDAAIGSGVVSERSCDDPKEEVFAATHKTEVEVPATDTLQRSQRTVAQEDVAPVEVEEVAPAKRRTRKSTRSKATAAARKGKNADSSDAAIEGTVVVSDSLYHDPKEDGFIVVVDEGATKPQEGILEELDQISIVQKSASLVKMDDSTSVRVWSKVEASDVYDKEATANETIKEDGFTLPVKVDQSNLLVNTLDRFAKPMHEFTVKPEKKEGECWWMLM